MDPLITPTDLLDLSDADLVRLAQEGCIEAGNILFTRHSNELKGFARRVYEGLAGKSDRGPEDLFQDAYRVAWAKFKTSQARHYFLPWMKTIIKNIARNWQRAIVIQLQILGTQGSQEDIDRIEAALTEGDNRDFAKLLQILEQKLTELKGGNQAIGRFILDYFRRNEEWPSLRQIAQDTGIPHMTVKRSRDRVLKTWKAACKRLGFWPLE